MSVRAWGQQFVQATMPQEDPVIVGSLWIDTSGTATLKVCTAISPYTFAAITGGATSDTVISNTDTGAQNNWAPTGLSGNTLIKWNGASDIAITGLAGGSSGQRVVIKNVTTAKVMTFAHLSGSSSAANQFTNYVTSAATPVAAKGSITFEHDGTNWQIAAHEQGAAITSTFAAGDYTADVGTLTVEAGDVESMGWKLDGRRLQVFISLNTMTVSGSAQHVRIAKGQWGGFTLDTTARAFIFAYVYDAGNTTGVLSAHTDADKIDFVRFDNGVLTPATNLLYCRGEFIGMVT